MNFKALGRRLVIPVLGLLLLSALWTGGKSALGGQDLQLTRQEKEWLKAHPVIRLAPDPDYPPIEYFNAEGEYRGIAADFVSLIEKRLGVKFEIVRLKNRDEILEKARKREIDMFGATAETARRAEYMLFTTPIIESPAVIIVRKGAGLILSLDRLKGMKVAVVSGYACHDFLADDYPEIDLETAPNVSTGLRMVAFGQVEAMIVSLAAATYYLEKEGIANLALAGDSGYSLHLAFASRKDWPLLNSIMEKALRSIDRSERKAIVGRWINLEQVNVFPHRRFWPALFIGLGTVAALIIGAAVWNRSLRRQVEERTKELSNELAERLRAEEALRASEAKYRELVENANSIILRIDVEGRVTFFNEFAQKFFGYSEEEILGRHVVGTIVPEIESSGRDLAAMIRDICLHPERYGQNENENIKRNGERVWISWTNKAVLDDEGRIKEILTVGNDMTGRRRAEERLAEREKEYRATFERTGTAMVVIEPDTTLSMVNSKFEELSGYTREEIEGKMSWREFVDPDDLKRMQDYHRRRRRQGQAPPKEYEFVFVDRYGNRRNVFNTVEVIPGTKRTVASLMDVTGLRRTEAALRESEARYRSLFDGVPVGIFRTTPQGRFLDANPALVEMLGYPDRGSLLESNTADLYLDPKARWRWQEIMDREGVVFNFEAKMRRYDGTIIWIRESSRAVRDDEGEIIHYEGILEDITERKRAKDALRESEERYRSVMEASAEPIVVYDLEGKATYINPAFTKVFGWQPEEVLNKRLDFVPHELRAEAYEGVMKVIRGEPFYGYETRRYTKSGEIIDVSISGARFCDPEGNPVGIVVNLRDITESKRAEEALRASEEKHRIVLEASPDPIVVYDTDGRASYINPAFTRVFGWTADEILGRRVDFVPRESWPETTRMIAAVTKGETISGVETKRYTKDGRLLDVAISSAPFFDSSGELTGIIVIHRDITESKRAEAALLESEAKYHRILEASPDPIVLYDMDGRTIYLNPAFTRVFGWSLDELLDKRVDFVPEEAWVETREKIEMIKRGESFSGFETRRLNKAGELLDISMSAAVWRDADGNPAGSVIILRDVTEQKKLEDQLRHARKMEAVGTLAGGVAHDFNNLLQAISGYAQLVLMQKGPNDPDYKYLTGIDQSVQRASDLVKQLLTASRKMESKLEPVNLNLEVIQAVNLLERTIPKMIEIKTQLADDLRMVNADPTQLEQILLNLGGNAKDAMPEGGRLIFETKNVELDAAFCRTHPELEPGDYVLLAVSDSGQGMDRETVEQIFDPFFTTKGVGKGTGLGLATVYGIVKNHGGHITCYSQPGQGTTFHIYLPALPGTEATREPIAELEAEIRGGDETVLLVDDERSILDVGQEILEQYGYRVIKATSGEEALEVYDRQGGGIDLIILDLGMPGMGGQRCLNELKARDPWARIVIASGYSESSLPGELQKNEDIEFIAKPYRLKDMLTTVRRVLDRD